jgi:hypothetical protein
VRIGVVDAALMEYRGSHEGCPRLMYPQAGFGAPEARCLLGFRPSLPSSRAHLSAVRPLENAERLYSRMSIPNLRRAVSHFERGMGV